LIAVYYRNPHDPWGGFFEQFDPLAAERVFEKREAGDIAPWARKALHQPGADGIGD
jgi:hypothetical protein